MCMVLEHLPTASICVLGFSNHPDSYRRHPMSLAEFLQSLGPEVDEAEEGTGI